MVNMLISVGVSLVIGVIIALIYAWKASYTKSFLTMIVMLPAVVCMVILMVNGSIGTGLAVAGAFTLVRFRSVPGNAKDIAGIFLAMACGLITAMGQYAVAFAFVAVMGIVLIVLKLIPFGTENNDKSRSLRITIPEDLNYSDAFDDLFEKYLSKCDAVSVKTSNMGSLYKLTYNVVLKDVKKEKEFLDEIRCRNGNLEVAVCRQEDNNLAL